MRKRSLSRITRADLCRLGELARIDRTLHFERSPLTRSLYERRLFAVALCQGAALHYLDKKNGVKDFDVWSFYTESSVRPFPARRVGSMDFGPSKFGKISGSRFTGRGVDCIGRSIPNAKRNDPIGTLRAYLRDGRTASARHLANKAVVLIEPRHLLGTVVWP